MQDLCCDKCSFARKVEPVGLGPTATTWDHKVVWGQADASHNTGEAAPNLSMRNGGGEGPEMLLPDVSYLPPYCIQPMQLVKEELFPKYRKEKQAWCIVLRAVWVLVDENVSSSVCLVTQWNDNCNLSTVPRHLRISPSLLKTLPVFYLPRLH